MKASRVKTLVVMSVLFLLIGLVSSGCGSKQETAWVNTKSMPGQTFTQHSANQTPAPSTIVYLGQDKTPQRGPNFGPRDVSFDFEDLK